jgi:hypothetical protein
VSFFSSVSVLDLDRLAWLLLLCNHLGSISICYLIKMPRIEQECRAGYGISWSLIFPMVLREDMHKHRKNPGGQVMERGGLCQSYTGTRKLKLLLEPAHPSHSFYMVTSHAL